MPASFQASIVMARAALHLNDVSQAVFTNTVLLPFLQVAWDELAEVFEENNNPATNETSTTSVVTTVMTDIGGSTGPALPTDLIEIQTLYERTNGSSESWQEMIPKTFLPPFVVKSTSLVYWAWMGQIIQFIGATTTRQIRIDYTGLVFNTLSGPTSAIAIFNSKNFLAYRTAALAADEIGENPTRAASLNSNAGSSLSRISNIVVKGQQNTPVRRRPFQASFRVNRNM